MEGRRKRETATNNSVNLDPDHNITPDILVWTRRGRCAYSDPTDSARRARHSTRGQQYNQALARQLWWRVSLG